MPLFTFTAIVDDNDVIIGDRGVMTDAQEANELVRRHLAALIVVAQQGSNDDVVRMLRMEMCRLVSAICTALGQHRLDALGWCPVCESTTCGLLERVRRALLPVRL